MWIFTDSLTIQVSFLQCLNAMKSTETAPSVGSPLNLKVHELIFLA